MPYPDLEQSVRCLGPTRLGNQVYREALSLLNGGWPHHPAAKLWANYKPALAQYCLYGMAELRRRNASPPTATTLIYQFKRYINNQPIILPPFIGYEPFHISHQDNLIFKAPWYYGPMFNRPVPTSKPDYIWPLHLISLRNRTYHAGNSKRTTRQTRSVEE